MKTHRLCQRPRRSVRAGAARLHEAGGAGLTRITLFGEELPSLENRVELASDKDEFGMPLAQLIHSFDDDAVALWNANFEEGLKVAKATGAKEVWSGSAGHADEPSASAGPSWAPARRTR